MAAASRARFAIGIGNVDSSIKIAVVDSAGVSDARPKPPAPAHLTKITARCDIRHSRSVRKPLAFQLVIFVSGGFKLAAVLLLTGFLAGPATALSSCWLSPGSGAAHRCAPGCPMMGERAATPLSIAQARHLNGPCCKVAPSKPAPISELAAPMGQFRVAPQTARVVLALPASMVREFPPSATAFPLSNAPAPSLLCTFLI